MTNKVIKYIENTLGIQIDMCNLDALKINVLPYYLTGAYRFFMLRLYNKEVIFAGKKSGEPITAVQYKNQMKIIENHFQKPVVLVLDNIESYNRNRLIEQGVNFVIPGKQMFMPYLMIDLKEFSGKPDNRNDKLFPAAQAVLLYHLQKENLSGQGIKSIANIMDYSEMTISRAMKNMEAKGLCVVTGNKELTLEFEFDKKVLWDKMMNYIKSPVKKTFYTNNIPFDVKKYKTNITALSFYSNLADDYIVRYAIPQYYYNYYFRNLLAHDVNDYEGNVFVEVWNYDPGRITNNSDYVDKLSLYITLMHDNNERVQMELDKLIKEALW